MSEPAAEMTPLNLLETALASCRSKRSLALVSLDNLDLLAAEHGMAIRSDATRCFQSLVNILLRPQDTLIPLTDNKVALVLDDLIDTHHLTLAGMKLGRIFASAVQLAGTDLQLEVSGGFVYLARLTELPDMNSLLTRAEAALDTAQQNVSGDGRYHVATLEDAASVDNHWQIGMRLQEAIEAHNIYMDYQPKVDLASGDVVGAEALVRWRYQGSVLPPNEYLPALQPDMMWELTVYCFRRVLRDILDFAIDIPIAVNFDPVTISEPDLVPLLQRETALWGVAPDQLVLELTEVSDLLDIDSARSTLNDIRALGFKVSIDDFGSGRSNIERLRSMPMDELKIDRSFSGNIIANEQNRVITRSLLDMAHSLGVTTVAEGIEDAESLEMLASWGCHVGQGFYLSAPLPIGELAALLP